MWPLGGPPLAAQSMRGCWRADRALGPTGGATPIERDAAFDTFVLRDSGRVALPLVGASQASMWNARSWWTARGDTLVLRVFTGLQGWHARFVATGNGSLRGTARYLSDVVVRGAPPLETAVALARVPCRAEWPSVAGSGPALRPWQRDEPLYGEPRVTVLASLPDERNAAARRRGLIAARPLGYNERAGLDSTVRVAGVGRVVATIVIEKSGRAVMTDAGVRATDDAAYTSALLRLLPSLRFTPAMVGDTAVHQVATWRFELKDPRRR